MAHLIASECVYLPPSKRLDALLADLQSTTSHITTASHPQQYNHPQTQVAPAHCGETIGDSRGSTPPPPLPPPPSQEVLDSLHNENSVIDQYHITAQQEVYEPRQFKHQIVHSNEFSYPAHQASPHQTIPHRQSGNPKQMSSLSNNLSELDSLLQDLSSAQFVAEVDRRNALNGTSGPVDHTGPAPVTQHQPTIVKERTVDSLLTELEGFVPPRGQQAVESPSHYEAVHQNVRLSPDQTYPQHSPVHPQHTATPPHHNVAPPHHNVAPPQHNVAPPHQNTSYSQAHPYSLESQPAASSATRELDDLMASLSEFKVTDPQPNSPARENPYSMPNKPGKLPQQPPGGSGVPAAPANRQNTQNNQLESMLGDLNTDMSRQGITTVPKGHCAACSKPIIGQVITALGKMWHPEHFVCTHCKEELGTQNFFERDGQPFCERDYHNLFAPRCALCHGPILDKCLTALDKTWHPEHFTCAECGRLLGESGFHEKEGRVYCREDYFKMFAPKCAGCVNAIMDNYITALSSQWHPECFVCYECRMPFGAGSFFEYDGMPYCEMHYHARRGSLCAGCQKPITGRCITAMQRKFHPEHFVCAFCLKQLNKGTFKEQGDKPYCHPCFVKIFG